MEKIRTLKDLVSLKEKLNSIQENRARLNHPQALIQVKIAMATCGIASGAREVMEVFQEEFTKRNIEAKVTQTGCMGYCYAEPTVEITLPGNEPLIFGYVDAKKASRIIDKYILNNELTEGIIPVNFEKI